MGLNPMRFAWISGLRPGPEHLSGPGAVAPELHAAPGDALPLHVTREAAGETPWSDHYSEGDPA